MTAAAGRAEAAPRVEARGVGLRAGLATTAFLVAALAISLAVGPFHVPVGSILRSALSYVPFLHVHQPLDALDRAVVWQVRAPRVALAALVGGMLAVAGASYQGVFRNPLCDPYLLGVAGAGFLVLADVVARTVLSPSELPIGVVTAFLGAPFFAVVLRTARGAR